MLCYTPPIRFAPVLSQQLQHALLMNTSKLNTGHSTQIFQCQQTSFISKTKNVKVIISNRLRLKVKTIENNENNAQTCPCLNSRIQQYLPDHPPLLPSLGSCVRGSPSVRPSSSLRPRKRRSSSSGIPRVTCSFGQAPSGSFCHAPVGIWEHLSKSNPSSCVDWLKASSKSAAPFAPFVSVSKHLQCFVKINLSKTPWDYDKCRYTIHLKPIQVNLDSHDNFTNLCKSELGKHPTETNKYAYKTRKPSTITLCEAHVEICILQVEPLGTTNFLPRCCWDLRTLTENQPFQLCRMAQGFKQICGALCSFRATAKALSLAVSVEAPAVFCQNQSVENTLGLRQVQVPNPSWKHPGQLGLIRQLHKSLQI